MSVVYFEIPGNPTISKMSTNRGRQGERKTLFFPDGATITAPNAALTSQTIPAKTQLFLETDGIQWVEIGRIAKPEVKLLNLISSSIAWRAFGLRKLRFNYAGAAIRVRRDSDNVEADIGFDADGELDTAALAAHVGANSGFVSKWYDQSSNGLDIAQATTSVQPRIVNAGTLDALDGKPAIKFDGTNDQFVDTTVVLFAAGEASAFMIGGGASIAAAKVIVVEGDSGGTAYYRLLATASNDKLASAIQNDASASILSQNGVAITFFDGTLRAGSVVDSAVYVASSDPDNPDPVYDHNLQSWRVDGANDASQTYVRSGTFASINRLVIGNRATGTGYYPRYLSELLLFAQAVGSADREIIESSQVAWSS